MMLEMSSVRDNLCFVPYHCGEDLSFSALSSMLAVGVCVCADIMSFKIYVVCKVNHITVELKFIGKKACDFHCICL